MPDHKTKPIDPLNPKQIKNFMKNFKQGSTDECWIWTGSRKGQWYGQFRVGKRMCSAHRVAFMFFTGEDPGPAMLLHKCDTAACINPSHLWKGSLAENSKDAAAKGRTAKGDKNGARLYPERMSRGTHRYNAKLTDGIVIEARQLRQEGWLYKDLATKYGVDLSTIYDAIKMHQWAHVK